MQELGKAAGSGDEAEGVPGVQGHDTLTLCQC